MVRFAASAARSGRTSYSPRSTKTRTLQRQQKRRQGKQKANAHQKGDGSLHCGGNAAQKMDQIWNAFSKAAVTENVESRRALLEKAAEAADELHGMTVPQAELEDGRMFMSMDELSAELDEIAHVIAGQSNGPQIS